MADCRRFIENTGVLLRAYVYARLLGRAGMGRVADYATLNANYLLAELAKAGFEPAFPQRRASHEFIITLKRQAKTLGITAMDFAKRLLDLGFHAPTTYFPMLVPECLLIEPTETECKEELDAFVAALRQIQQEAETGPGLAQERPASPAGGDWTRCGLPVIWIWPGVLRRPERQWATRRTEAGGDC